MSAAELLKQVRGLPPSERHKLIVAILSLEDGEPIRTRGKAKRVRWPDIEARARRIFGDRILPNLVLMEREEASA